MINYPDIMWIDQCDVCLRALNTSHCIENQGFMKLLQDKFLDYRGTLEFECEFFSPDLVKLTKKE